MPKFRIRPIQESIAARVRETLRDPIYGLPVRIEPATGYGPCRLCLRTFSPEERRILFLYNPFSAQQDADFAGPIFIHADACRAFDEPAFPDEIARLPILLRSYDGDGRRLAEIDPKADAAPGADLSAMLELLLEPENAAFVHVRNAEAKCFIAAVEGV